MLKDIFGFAEHHEKGTYGLGYNLILTRNCDNAVSNKINTINDAKIKIKSIHWYVPPYTRSFEQQIILMNENIGKMATELQYSERSVFLKQVNTQKLWTFELGAQKGVYVLVWIYVIFQQSDRQHYQTFNNDRFCRMPLTFVQCIIGSEKYLDRCLFLKYDNDD